MKQQKMESQMGAPELTPFQVLLSAFAISSFGGLAALLRSRQELTARSVITAFLYSGLLGLVIALLWYNKFGDTNIYFLLGVSGLAGIGGLTVVDFIVQVLKKGGVDISIRPKESRAVKEYKDYNESDT